MLRAYKGVRNCYRKLEERGPLLGRGRKLSGTCGTWKVEIIPFVWSEIRDCLRGLAFLHWHAIELSLGQAGDEKRKKINRAFPRQPLGNRGLFLSFPGWNCGSSLRALGPCMRWLWLSLCDRPGQRCRAEREKGGKEVGDPP